MFVNKLCPKIPVLSQCHALVFQRIRPSQVCLFSNKVNLNKNIIQKEIDPETGEIKKKKTPFVPKITLLSGNDVSVTTLEEAQKLAKRRDLKLVKTVDLESKTQRPVYRLMTGAEYFEEDLKQRERKKLEKQKSFFKGEKLLIVRENITEHDLTTHLNKILKWLAKKYEVRMVISGSGEGTKAEEVFSLLEKNLSGQGRILQKRQKGTDIRFQVVPPKSSKSDGEGEDSRNTK